MSWSFSAIGTPERIAQSLEEESSKMTGQSKVEFDEAKPHLAELVKQNFVKEGSGHTPVLLNFSASGSGSAVNGEQRQRTCKVNIEPMYAKLLV